MAFHWSLSDGKSSQLSRTLLSILANFNNVVVWLVSIRPPISNSFSPPPKPLADRSKCTNDKCFKAFLVLWQDLSTCLTFSYFDFLLCYPPRRCTAQQGSFVFVLFWFVFFCFVFFWGGVISPSLVLWLGLSDQFISPNPREFYASPQQILVCAFTTWLYGKISTTCTISSGSSYPVVSTLYSFCASLLHSLLILFCGLPSQQRPLFSWVGVDYH